MLHHIEYVHEKLTALGQTGVTGNPNGQELKQPRFVMDFRCESCRQWRADTRARRSVVNGTRYLSNLCAACAHTARTDGHTLEQNGTLASPDRTARGAWAAIASE